MMNQGLDQAECMGIELYVFGVKFPVQGNLIIFTTDKQMAASKQIVVSLNRLTITPLKNHHRMLLSALTPHNQYFIRNSKVVKAHKISFYRQSLFISDLTTDLCFNLYDIDASNNRELVTTFRASEAELKAINKRPTTFHLTSDHYELDWDGWLFSQNSSDLNQSTEKDYSQLDLPFQNEEDEPSQLVLSNSHSQKLRRNKLGTVRQPPYKRSSSTEQTPSLTDEVLQFSEDGQNKSKGHKQVEMRTRSHLLNRNISSLCLPGSKKKKTHIKSHLYSCLVSGISQLLSPPKS